MLHNHFPCDHLDYLLLTDIMHMICIFTKRVEMEKEEDLLLLSFMCVRVCIGDKEERRESV